MGCFLRAGHIYIAPVLASTDSADQDADVADATHTVRDRSSMKAYHTHLSSDEEAPIDDVMTPSARGLEQLYGTTQHRRRRTLDVENNKKRYGGRGRERRGMVLGEGGECVLGEGGGEVVGEGVGGVVFQQLTLLSSVMLVLHL